MFFNSPDDDYAILSEGTIICPGESKYVTIEVLIDSNSTTVPSSAIEISNFGTDYNFVQADMSVCS